MFIPIKIDLDELVEEFGLDGAQIKLLGTELINRIGDKYFAAIKQKVNTTLKATRGIYLKNLRIETIDDFKVVFTFCLIAAKYLSEIRLVNSVPKSLI